VSVRWLLATALRVAALCLLASGFVTPATAASIVTTHAFESKALGRTWAYSVYVPDGYETSGLQYPVLYLLHGNNGSRTDWAARGGIQRTADELIAAGEIPPALIVMPDAGSTWYVDRKENMETAVIRDLIPDVETNFRAITERGGRLVGGLSMGGYGALRFVLKYPDSFAAAALLSPAIYNPEPPASSGARKAGVFGSPQFDPEVWKSLNYPALWDAFLARKIRVPMYITSGDDDELFIEEEAVRLYSLLRRNGQPAELRISDGAHTWPVWEAAIGDAMRYIFRFATRPVVQPPPPPRARNS
jgi:S-formylglutathione hydrolase FrmB